MMVTSVPKLRKMELNSTPTAPAPMTMSDLGTAGMERISMLVRMRVSASRPGSILASEPVATMIFLALRKALLAGCAAAALGVDADGVDAVLGGAGEAAVALDGGDLVLASSGIQGP